MARAFHIGRDGLLVAHLEPDERDLLIFLLDELAELVVPDGADDTAADFFEHLQAQWDASPGQRSHDPAVSRLFPDAFPDDEQASADFRRFTEQNLRSTRSLRVGELRDIVKSDALELTVQQGHDALQVLTDLRLVLGTRLDVRDDTPRPPSQGIAGDVYDWLTWLQESLVQAMFQLPPRR